MERTSNEIRTAGGHGGFLPRPSGTSGCPALLASLAITVLFAPPAQAAGGAPVLKTPVETAGGVLAGAADIAKGAVDLAVLRPLGVIATGAGSVFFVASAPFVAPSGNLSEAWDMFLYAPLEYTFQRPIGDF